MMAELLHISVRVVRRWQQLGLLHPVKEVLRLPYFDYLGVANAKQLLAWMRNGITAQSIFKQLCAHQLLNPKASCEVLLSSLPLLVDGKKLVLRTGEQLLEANGQLRFGFDEPEHEPGLDEPYTLLLSPAIEQHAPSLTASSAHLSLEQIIDCAIEAEDCDNLPVAIEYYRTALAAYGPRADICFQLAEILYRQGELTAARERYFMALELDPGMIEARANLGCVLAECGDPELAIAAFEGTLQQLPDYADVHFHLARVLDDFGQSARANEHWQQFLELAPESPWAEEAADRLSASAPTLDY